MATIELHFHVNAPLQHVWEFGVRLNEIPKWQPGVIEVRDISSLANRIGLHYTLIYQLALLKCKSRIEVTAFIPLKLISIKGKMPIGGTFSVTTTMEADSQGTTIHYRMDYKLPGGILGEIADRILIHAAFKRYIQQANNNYRILIETALLESLKTIA